jgi:tetratricopeptide (TPR) repeat protein
MDSSSDTDDFDCELAFATLDLTGVEFIDEDENQAETKEDSFALEIERKFLDGEEIFSDKDGHENHLLFKIQTQLDNGEYISILTGQTSKWLLSDSDIEIGNTNIWNRVRTKLAELKSISECVEAEFFAIAALNIFLQLNYTGPFFEETNALDGIDPHPCFAQCLKSLPVESEKEDQRHSRYQNAVLSELTVDGIWPCQVAKVPYLLLLARCILLTLSHPEKQCWADNTEQNNDVIMPSKFCKLASRLRASPIWSARSTVAHERLLLSREPTTTLWEELESTFPRCISSLENSSRQLKATVLLEYGLACHHFEREKKGKEMFQSAMITSGLTVEVTGQMGKRTKYQTKATAQMVVRAVSAPQDENICTEEKEDVKAQMVQHTEDSILLERVKFDEEVENDVSSLTILDQAIILALCLDVKNNNPSDGLTAEEMSAYLARVLCHHDDWTIYSTALLERAWLEFEGNHTKERAILQLQALADQHTQKLTITQSTRKSIDESSPVQDRLKNVHSIVYPPRWHMLRDVAERYAELGIVTSAAEIFTEIEYWDEVVDCYRRAGKKKRAEEIVRERLSLTETPRMWVALGDISNELSCYEKAIELSNGRFCQAYVSLGEHLFRKGELRRASENYHKALKMRLLLPRVWFRVGTISMQLGDWQLALKAFSEVVQQQPDEGDAWANMAAVHIHEKRPAEAYPALTEVSFCINKMRLHE